MGRTWIYQFLKRQEELRTCYVRSLTAERALAGNNPARVQQFFKDYTTAKTQYNVAELAIWNMDETGYAMGFAYSAKVVVLRGSLVNFKTIDRSGEWVSQIDGIGMHGQTIPPFIIFRGRQHTASLWQEAVEAVGDCIIGMSENGWLNQELGMSGYNILSNILDELRLGRLIKKTKKTLNTIAIDFLLWTAIVAT